jgi:putative endonuclease
MEYFVYILINTHSNRTYIGLTNNLAKRIRQHNGIIKGGAKYTKINKMGGIWKYYFTINNLNKQLAKKIEYEFKNIKIYGYLKINEKINKFKYNNYNKNNDYNYKYYTNI